MTRTAALLIVLSVAASTSAAPPGRLVDVGGRRLHLHCTGKGSPTVILEAGASSGFYSFWEIQSRIPFRTCSYDRAGFGFSEPRPGRRVSADIVADLRALLARAGEKPPFLLVGHSLGGYYVRRYAELHPDEVAGLVLLDAVHEDSDRLRPAEVEAAFAPLREAAQATRRKTLEEGRRTGRWPAGPLPEFLPKAFASALTRRMQTQTWWEARDAEGEILERDPPIPREKRRLTVPLVVMTATGWGKLGSYSDETHDQWTRYRVEMGKELASRSPRSKHVVLEGKHGVHWDAPDAVVEAIVWVARAASFVTEPSR